MGSGKEKANRRVSRKFRRSSDFLQTYEKGNTVEGWLKKKSSSGLWQKRWFVLHERYLTYLKKEPKSMSDFEKAIGSINLWNVEQVSVEDEEITIRFGSSSSSSSMESNNPLARTTSTLARMLSIYPDQMLLRAEDADMAQRWVQAMYAGALEGRAQQAFNAEGTRITHLVNEKDDPTRLKVDMADPTIRRDEGLDVHAFRVVASRGSKPLFESKRLFGMTRLTVGKIPAKGRVIVQLSRGGKDVGTISSEHFELYRTSKGLTVSKFTVVLIDESVSKDAVKMEFEQDIFHAARHSLAGPRTGVTGSVAIVLLAALVATVGPVLGPILWSILCVSFVSSVVVVNKDSAVLTSVQVIPMHEARILLNRLSKKSKRASKRFSAQRLALQVENEELNDGVEGVEGDDTSEEEVGDGPELSPKEKMLLNELRERVKDMLDVKDPEAQRVYRKYIECDWRLVRYLRARNLNLKKSEKFLRKSLEWRVEYNAEGIHDEFTPPEWILEYFGCESILKLLRNGEDRLGWYFRDHKGSLGAFVRTGGLNQRKMYKKLGDGEALFRVGVWLFQMIQMDLDEHFEREGGNVSSQISLVVDLEGFQVSNQIPIDQALGLARKYLPKLLDGYPEVLGRVIVVNAPWLFHSIWSLFTPILPERVISKITIMGSNKRKLTESVATLFASDQTPQAYGGSYVESDGDPYCPLRVPCQGPYLPDKGASLLELPKKKK